jgi:uncharacterized protein with FMN-binding domain
VPKRGAVALVTTVLAVLLLLGFKTDDRPGPVGNLPTAPVIGAPSRQTPDPVAVGPVAVGPQPSPTRKPAPGTTPAPAADPTQAPPTDPPAQGSGSGTLTGQAIDTPYGVVQVAVVMKAGKIVDVQELQMPFDRQLSAQISQEAGPLLRNEVLRAQSANINGVSGASYTSYGFYQSLQSALSQVP